MLPSDAVDSITSSMSTLKADPDAIEQVRRSLNKAIGALQNDDYDVMGLIGAESFGTTASATTLTFHHGLAHTVVDDMLTALAQDLATLATNLAKAAAGVTQADIDAGADVKAKQAIIETLTYSSDHTRTTARYSYDRNHQQRQQPISCDGEENH